LISFSNRRSIEFSISDLDINDECQGRNYTSCAGAGETCDEVCQWSSCQVVLKNDLGQAVVYENACVDKDLKEEDIEKTCSSNFGTIPFHFQF
jgi:hypothetical protein